MDKEGFRKHTLWIRDGYENQVEESFKGIERFAQIELADTDWLEEMLAPSKQTSISSVPFARKINSIVCNFDDKFTVGSLLLWRNNNHKIFNSPEPLTLDKPPKEWQDFVNSLSAKEKMALGTSIAAIFNTLKKANQVMVPNVQGIGSLTMEHARGLEDLIEERDDLQFYKEEIFAAVAFRRKKD